MEAYYYSILIVTMKRGLGSIGRVRSLAADMHFGRSLILKIVSIALRQHKPSRNVQVAELHPVLPPR